jgi:hypothetical protein
MLASDIGGPKFLRTSIAKLAPPICYELVETFRRARSFLLMTDDRMILEYNWISNEYRSRLGGAFSSGEHSFETLAAARHDLRLIGLRIGDKTDVCTWRVEFMEPVAERADTLRLGSWANRNRKRAKRPDPSAYRQNG